jgi:hypothetical protein
MATYTKFNAYVDNLNKAVINWSTHTFKGSLENTAPVATNSVFADLTEIAPGNGYSAGGQVLDSVTLSNSSGTEKVVIADEVYTASGGSIGPFRYFSIYDDTPTSPADPLVGFYDYGSSITLLNTETFTVDFDATNGLWQMA